MEPFIKQTISSTHLDSQGEKVDLDLLNEFADVINRSGKFPIGQQHDANLGYAGYMENAFVEEDPNNSGEYFLKADIYCKKEDLEILSGGFSFSINLNIKSNTEKPLFGVYLPYPFYKSDEKINRVLELDSPIKAGKWLKKSDDPNTIALVISFVTLFLGPLWKQVYNEKIAPHVAKILRSDKIDTDLKRDFAIPVRDSSEEVFTIYFSTAKNDLRSLDPFIIKSGIQKVFDFIESDDKASKVGLSQVRMKYISTRTYEIHTVTYRNGEYLNEQI